MWEQGWMGTFVNTLLTLENSSGSFPDVAKANPLCSPPVRCWSHLSITWGLMLPRCPHSVSSLFTCLAIDHFPLSLHLHWKVGYRGETKAKFKQINCIVCRRQQVCYFHYQQCSSFLYSPPPSPSSHNPPSYLGTFSTDCKAGFRATRGNFFTKRTEDVL